MLANYHGNAIDCLDRYQAFVVGNRPPQHPGYRGMDNRVTHGVIVSWIMPLVGSKSTVNVSVSASVMLEP